MKKTSPGWNPAKDGKIITTIDAHTAGEPLRIMAKGLPDISGDTILAKRRYFQDMYDHLKKALDVRALVVGTSDHNHYRSGYPLLSSTSLCDVVDGHVYWQHPSYGRDAESGQQTFTIPNTPR